MSLGGENKGWWDKRRFKKLSSLAKRKVKLEIRERVRVEKKKRGKKKRVVEKRIREK